MAAEPLVPVVPAAPTTSDIIFYMAKAYVLAMAAATLVLAVVLWVMAGAPAFNPFDLAAAPMSVINLMILALPGFALVRAGFYLMRVSDPVLFALAGLCAALLTWLALTLIIFLEVTPSDLRFGALAGIGGLVSGFVYARVERKELAHHV